MFWKNSLSAVLATAAAVVGSPAIAAVKEVKFTVGADNWIHASGPTAPYGLSLQPTLFGSLRYDDMKSSESSLLSMDYSTGSKVWSIDDLKYYYIASNGHFFFDFGPGNNVGSANSSMITEGPSTIYCNYCVSIVSVSAVPEPQTWGLMIAGFGLIGTALRRRKAMLAA